jgi:hypothetical protein
MRVGWENILQITAPWLTQGAGGAAFALVWLVRSQFQKIEGEQRQQGALLRRLVRLHCERYPKESYRLLEENDG